MLQWAFSSSTNWKRGGLCWYVHWKHICYTKREKSIRILFFLFFSRAQQYLKYEIVGRRYIFYETQRVYHICGWRQAKNSCNFKLGRNVAIIQYYFCCFLIKLFKNNIADFPTVYAGFGTLGRPINGPSNGNVLEFCVWNVEKKSRFDSNIA